MTGKAQIQIELASDFLTVEELINQLICKLGQKFEHSILNTEQGTLKPEILIFVDNFEIQTLQKLKTRLFNGSTVTFLSSIHGG